MLWHNNADGMRLAYGATMVIAQWNRVESAHKLYKWLESSIHLKRQFLLCKVFLYGMFDAMF